ncbi:hypothetical protein GCM10010411_15350 [Actinomadura fulvescens]|uniref:N-acetyltransferase domain-containing protein n=2 Tax=Actinomadura fulvescens TaxID=46160 RepID=A0ABN3PHK6_9ACTN
MGVRDDVNEVFKLIDDTEFGSEEGYVRNVYRTLPDMNKRVLGGLETLFVAFDEAGELVSAVSVTRRPEPGNASIPMVVTAVDKRKQGYCTALLDFTIKTLAELGFRKVFVTCPLDNVALQGALVRSGFSVEGQINDVYGSGGHAVMCGRQI